MARTTTRRAGTLVLGLALSVTAGLLAPATVSVSPASAGPAVVAHGGHTVPLAQKRAETKWYVVQPSFNGEPEFLFAIAERFLGDGNRANEIFELNRGRLQYDGKRVEKAEVIEPGWILQLPSDAKGEGVQVGPLPSVPAVEPGAASAPASEAAAADPGTAEAADEGGASPVLLVVIGVVVLLLIIGGVVAFLLLRGRSGGGGGAPKKQAVPKQKKTAAAGPAPARTFDTAAAWTIDRGLRALVTASATASRSIPPVYGVSLDAERMVLRLAAPDGEPVEPWESIENGRVWQASLRDLQTTSVSDEATASCPRLVTLGIQNGVRELVDLGQATGVISLQGDAALARDLVGTWVEELMTSPWSGTVRVVAGDVRPGLAGGLRLSSLGSVRDAITHAEGEQDTGTYALRGGQFMSVNAQYGVLILGSAPGARDMERVQRLVSRPDAAWVVIVLGQTRYDRWRFTIRRDGLLDTGALGITVYTASTAAGAAR